MLSRDIRAPKSEKFVCRPKARHPLSGEDSKPLDRWPSQCAVDRSFGWKQNARWWNCVLLDFFSHAVAFRSLAQIDVAWASAVNEPSISVNRLTFTGGVNQPHMGTHIIYMYRGWELPWGINYARACILMKVQQCAVNNFRTQPGVKFIIAVRVATGLIVRVNIGSDRKAPKYNFGW